jgi:hypothetical protein
MRNQETQFSNQLDELPIESISPVSLLSRVPLPLMKEIQLAARLDNQSLQILQGATVD